MVNESIFRSYDIRGLFPSELNEESAFAIGRAFARSTGAKRIVLGHDARNSSPALLAALAGGIRAEGGQVYDICKAPTECLYFALGNYDFDAGIMVTASHNPKEYNGFKMIKKTGKGLEMLRGKDLFPEVKNEKPSGKEDQENEKKDVWKDFIQHALSFVDLSEIVPAKVVVDASNGVAGLAISKIQDILPVEIIPLHFNPDGNFPNHSPNPLEAGSVDKIGEVIKEKKADFGFIFDGDADRVFLVDENGQLVSADVTLLLLAKYFLEKNPGAAIAYNLICSKAVPKFISEWGGKPVRTQVGFVNVREGLIQNNGIMGGELSSHYCYKDNFYMDSGIISFLSLLQIISKDSRKLSEIVKELSPYAKSAELNFKVEDKESVLEVIKEKYVDGKQDFLDGITVEYEDWWFNVRPSNTEPLLRLTIEADTKEILEKNKNKLIKLISK